ncbi:MAG: hypothetical protein Q3971_04160 [Moraxella sp.]|nr:hypothetical protein [Moraxella sp.]
MSDKQSLIDEFARCALALRELADKLGHANFAKMMNDTLSCLCDDGLDDKQKLLQAYERSRVFGGMGSWVDSPFCTAHELGLSDEYDKITDEFWQIRQKARKNARW